MRGGGVAVGSRIFGVAFVDRGGWVATFARGRRPVHDAHEFSGPWRRRAGVCMPAGDGV
jgi:hypothetical protein